LPLPQKMNFLKKRQKTHFFAQKFQKRSIKFSQFRKFRAKRSNSPPPPEAEGENFSSSPPGPKSHKIFPPLEKIYRI
jgi:hypothetical protein